MTRFLCACLLASTALTALPGVAWSQDAIFDDFEPGQLEGQDQDANADLVNLLDELRRKGPSFEIEPENVTLSMETGETRATRITIFNQGDQAGRIESVGIVGSFPNLDLETDCEDDLLQPADFCAITLSYEGAEPGRTQSAIRGRINQQGRPTFEIPVTVSVQDLPPAPEPGPEPEPGPVVVAPPPAPAGPQPRDIVRQYYGVVGPIGRGAAVPRGFTIVSAPEDPYADQTVAGSPYEELRVRRVTTAERYDEAIPSTTASLPVDRDRILTSDRVIKAVLETPVSNVMCNKVVAMVESDVYSATSRRPLIQAGSRVIGECQQFVDERVGIAWSRIITTDGRSILFENREADTNDATGIGGALGRVYMSPFDRYVLPIFSTMIDTAAGVIFAAFGEDEEVVVDENGNRVTGTNARNEGLRIVTGEARQTAQDVIKDIRDVRKIAIVPKGSRIDIEIMEDIYFREDRKVVTLGDMRFELGEVTAGVARRDLPERLVLDPVAPGYEGPTIMVEGRRYSVSGSGPEADGEPGAPDVNERAGEAPERSRETLNDLSLGGEG